MSVAFGPQTPKYITGGTLQERFASYREHYPAPVNGGLGTSATYGRERRWGLHPEQIKTDHANGHLTPEEYKWAQANISGMHED
jgi:hypothetical protein